MQNLKRGTGLAPPKLTVLGNTPLAGNLGVIGVATLDDANVGTLLLQQSGTNKQLNVYGNTNVTGTLPVAGTDAISELSNTAPKNNPTFTDTVSGISKSMVDLGNVDNASDATKPISDSTQTALNSINAK